MITRYRGDTRRYTIQILDENGAPIPLTTETFKLSVSTTENPTAAADVFTATGVISDAALAKVYFPIPGTTAAGDYFYDIQVTDTNSEIETLEKGVYEVPQDITK